MNRDSRDLNQDFQDQKDEQDGSGKCGAAVCNSASARRSAYSRDATDEPMTLNSGVNDPGQPVNHEKSG